MAPIVGRSAIVLAVAGSMLVLASAAGAAKSGVWSGTTSQTDAGVPMPFALEVTKSEVSVINFGADFTGNSASCRESDSSGAEEMDSATGFLGFPIKKKHFGGTVTIFGQKVSIKGTFKNNTVRGSLSDSYKASSIRCKTGQVRFSARPGGSLHPEIESG